MKQLVLAIFALTLTVGAIAQVKKSTSNPGGFFIKGGVNFANISVTDGGRVDDANQLTSFHAGGVFDIPLAGAVSIQPGLLLTGKGSKTVVGNESGANYWKATSNPLYVELPVNFVFKIPMDEYSRIFFGAGPYAAAGVAGKNKTEGKAFGISFSGEKDINYSDDDPTTSNEENAGYGKLKRFDYGLNALAGIEFNKFSFGAGYGYGLAKINSNTNNNSNDKGKNRVLSFSLAVKL